MAPKSAIASGKVEQIPALHAWHTVRWTPLRRHFGINAFGVNVYAVEKAGDTVIISHSEDEGDPARGHEELYIVLAGRAKFIVGDRVIDAPTGTCVYVGDPFAERMATAEVPDTRILAIGGKPGEAFKPSAWEFAAAVAHHYDSHEYETALTLAREGVQLHPRDARLVYNVACLEALNGDSESALVHLERAVDLRPDLAEHAAHDHDLEHLRGDGRFPAAAQ
jgi:hypothetical protein